MPVDLVELDNNIQRGGGFGRIRRLLEIIRQECPYPERCYNIIIRS
jgi:hypothetical protein